MPDMLQRTRGRHAREHHLRNWLASPIASAASSRLPPKSNPSRSRPEQRRPAVAGREIELERRLTLITRRNVTPREALPSRPLEAVLSPPCSGSRFLTIAAARQSRFPEAGAASSRWKSRRGGRTTCLRASTGPLEGGQNTCVPQQGQGKREKGPGIHGSRTQRNPLRLSAPPEGPPRSRAETRVKLLLYHEPPRIPRLVPYCGPGGSTTGLEE